MYIYYILYIIYYIYIYILQSRCNNNVQYFPKLLKAHFFVMQIFRSHFGSIYLDIYVNFHLNKSPNFCKNWNLKDA